MRGTGELLSRGIPDGECGIFPLHLSLAVLRRRLPNTLYPWGDGELLGRKGGVVLLPHSLDTQQRKRSAEVWEFG